MARVPCCIQATATECLTSCFLSFYSNKTKLGKNYCFLQNCARY